MGGAVIELIPFKVELAKFEELDTDWGLYERMQHIGASHLGFLQVLSRSGAVASWQREYDQKMMEHPFRKAVEKVYTEWAAPFSGEWIVVGKIGEYYLAAQPRRITQMLPMECCRFIGLL